MNNQRLSNILKYGLVAYAYARIKFEDEQNFIERASEGNEETKQAFREAFQKGYFSLTLGGHLFHRLKGADKKLVGKYISQILQKKQKISLLSDLSNEEIKGMCALTEYIIEDGRSLLDGVTPIGPETEIFDKSYTGSKQVIAYPYLDRAKSVLTHICFYSTSSFYDDMLRFVNREFVPDKKVIEMIAQKIRTASVENEPSKVVDDNIKCLEDLSKELT